MADLGPPTSGILPLVAPDIYGQELANQRRRAFAQMLLQGQDESNRPWSGLKNAGNSILGAYLLKKSDENDLAIARQYQQIMLGGGQSSQQPQSPMTPQRPLGGGMSGMADQLNAPPQQAPVQGPVPQQPMAQGNVGASPPQVIPDIPGVSPQEKMIRYVADPSAYMKAYWDSIAQTPDMKNIGAAYGPNSPEYVNALQGKAQKDAAILGRPSGVVIINGKVTGIPGPAGLTPTQLPNGQIGLQMAPGSQAAVGQSAFAQGVGRAATTPAIGYDKGGNPIATNQATMAGQGATAGAMGIPGPFAGYQTPSPVPGGAPVGGGPSLAPELSASQKPFLSHQGETAGSAFSDAYTEAEGAPDRINVLSNIINLSRQGALSGPGSGWLGNMAGVAATMGIKGFTPTAEKYQELTKFTYQNAIRAWQTAGGTGTDTQHEAQMHANVNTEMNPGALQSIAQWALAGEHAVMGKANAQNQWLQRQGNTPQAQLGFENAWRNAMDRRVFILNTLPPPEQKAYVQSLSPADAKALLEKRQLLRSLGAF